MSRLKTVFHESLYLSRPSIQQILQAFSCVSFNKGSKLKFLREHTTLGTNQVKSFPRYALGAGLLYKKSRLTPFGRLAVQHDPQLSRPATQWLMHYYLSAPHGPGPAFWHELVVRFFRPGDRFTAQDITSHIADFAKRTEGQPLAERSVRSTANAFLGTYAKSDGLSALGLLDQDGSTYHVRAWNPPPAWVVAVALADYWQHHFAGRISINESDLLNESTLPELFGMGHSAFDGTLRELQRSHVIDLHRTAPPYQVVLLQPDPESHLIQLYGNNNAGPIGGAPAW